LSGNPAGFATKELPADWNESGKMVDRKSPSVLLLIKNLWFCNFFEKVAYNY
jgi:hypothetical protein